MSQATRLTTGLVVLVAGLLAGCTSTSSGDPQPTGSATTGNGDGSEATSESPPTRPREIVLDDVDPCALLPQADYPDYYLDEPGKPGTNDKGAVECAWYGEIGYMDVVLVTYEGVEAREDGNGQMEPTDPIEDFPAYTITLPGDDNRCFIVVDVADGQHLDVQVGLDAFPENIPPTCEYAHQFASSVMSTLVAS